MHMKTPKRLLNELVMLALRVRQVEPLIFGGLRVMALGLGCFLFGQPYPSV